MTDTLSAAAAHPRVRAARYDARSAPRIGVPRETESYEAIDYGLTALLIRAAVLSGSRPRFVYLSSFGVREHSTNPYLVARWRAESLLRASGLPYTIARPSFITGPGRDESRPLERAGAGVANVIAGARPCRGRASLRGKRPLADRRRSSRRASLGTAFDPAAENVTLGTEELAPV